MRTVADVRHDVVAQVDPTPSTTVPPVSAAGLVLAADVVARIPLPRFDNAAMDGYAVHHEDVDGAQHDRPARIPVVASVAAGAGRGVRLRGGEAARIMTGALLPAGATAVVPHEWTDRGSTVVAVHRSVAPGRHVRRAGEDLREGDLAVRAGTVLRSRHLGVLAALGVTDVPVHPAPRVGVVATGSELRRPGEPLLDDGIHDSNSVTVAAAVREAGGVVTVVRTVGDDIGLLTATLDALASDVDVVVTTGGVSEGDHDVVRLALTGRGTMWFGTVAMQPGKPQGFGRLKAGGPLVCCLPGNPVAATTSFHVFVRPALLRLRGLAPSWPTSVGILTEDVRSPAGRTQFVRGARVPGVQQDRDHVVPRGTGSHMVAAMAGSDVLVVVPAATTLLRAGDEVTLLHLDPDDG
ncbi:gephyrin-like molybdotransferase Glp [Nocardioides alkalitolerans]|uniref:molybdopterin molybdotransferase MoeA n=1 Tax=Nocardioides alkalitolerans TaxID=281714 RepID=UPI00048AC7B9|nr:gephyrin-like molybdotransferase Glp [Nocardioides alkalitolerans]